LFPGLASKKGRLAIIQSRGPALRCVPPMETEVKKNIDDAPGSDKAQKRNNPRPQGRFISHRKTKEPFDPNPENWIVFG
jgi:hypothetical protein